MTEKHATVKSHVWAAWDEPRPAVPGAVTTGTTPSIGDVTPPPALVAVSGPVVGSPEPTASAGPTRVLGTVEPSPSARPTPAVGTPISTASAGPISTEGPLAPPAIRDVAPAVAPSAPAEAIRRRLASAWGEIGSSWGVPPATARVHGYLLAHRRPLSEREIRLALGLSHRATSLALAESASWGLIERVPEARRSGRRGPAGAAWVAVGDHWRWFGRVVEQRRMREGDPAVAAIARAAEEAADASGRAPDDRDLEDLGAWLDGFLGFVRLFDRAAALVARMPPADLERAMTALGGVPDEAALRMLGLLAAVSDDDLSALIRVAARLSPGAAPRAARLAARVLGGLAR